MLDDGYGDSPSEFSVSEFLDSYSGWLRRVALTMVQRHDLRFDDVIQEGSIALWKAVQNHNPDRGPLDFWAKQSAEWAMKEAILGLPATGESRTRTTVVQTRGTEARDAIRAYLKKFPDATYTKISEATGVSRSSISYHMKRMTHDTKKPDYTLLSALLEDIMEDPSFDITDAGDLLERVLSAYHNGEILSALSALTPNERKYVDLRFWQGLLHTELTKAFGYNPGAIWTSAKKKLVPHLQHLISV